jgi:hypothetical protein
MPLRQQLISVFQRSYRRKWTISCLYWTLAKRESRSTHRAILQSLALKAERSAVQYALRLSRLGGTLPSNRRSLGERLWALLLVHCPLSWAIAWLRWLEKRDLHDLKTLLVFRGKPLAKSSSHQLK